MLHLMFHDHPNQHAIATISLLMKQNESEVKFNVAINGINRIIISDHLNEEKMSLATS